MLGGCSDSDGYEDGYEPRPADAGADFAEFVEIGAAVIDYCTRFARVYASEHDTAVVDGSVRAEDGGWKRRMQFQDLFQREGSRITAHYNCRFDTALEAVSVRLFLVETYDHADFIKWDRLQLVPIELVEDDATDRAGYGVFKYMDAEPHER